MSEPTCRALRYSGADCLSSVGTYLLGTVLQWCRLFKRCRNLPTGHCVTVVKTVKAVSEPTCRALCYSGATVLAMSEPTYRHCVTVMQTVLAMSGPTYRALCYSGATVLAMSEPTYRHCVTVMQTVLAMSEPTYRALCYSGADCLSNVRTYLQGTVLQWCRLFKQCQNLPTGHCVTVAQAVKAESEPTYQALCYSGADCFSDVSTYLPRTVLQGCRLYKRCQNLPAGHCVTVVQAV